MSSASSVPITELLQRWQRGDSSVEDELISEVYPVMRRLARSLARRHGRRVELSPTELANETYERLCKQRLDWQNRGQFYAMVATVLRRVIVDHLRERGAAKRGGGEIVLALGDVSPNDQPATSDSIDWVALDRALDELTKQDPTSARVVELRLFSGLTPPEIAQVCALSVATVGRRWLFAKTWLAERLEQRIGG
jgi:RNA polymerase sigma factor (TIGR02999 family)